MWHYLDAAEDLMNKNIGRTRAGREGSHSGVFVPREFGTAGRHWAAAGIAVCAGFIHGRAARRNRIPPPVRAAGIGGTPNFHRQPQAEVNRKIHSFLQKYGSRFGRSAEGRYQPVW